jgi:hypothetical protein
METSFHPRFCMPVYVLDTRKIPGFFDVGVDYMMHHFLVYFFVVFLGLMCPIKRLRSTNLMIIKSK